MSDQHTSSSSAGTITLDATERKHLSHIAHLAVYRALQRCVATVVTQIDETVPEQRPVVFVDRLIDERDALLVDYIHARIESSARTSIDYLALKMCLRTSKTLLTQWLPLLTVSLS